MPSATWGCFSVVPFSGHPCLGPEAVQKLCGNCAEADGISRGTRAEMFGVTFLGSFSTPSTLQYG